jgi:aminoglycoside phosphotransferase family enzyme
MQPEPNRQISNRPSLAEKLARLAEPSAYPRAPARVDFIETHMSCVFLVGDRVYKMKKPVRFAFLDFSTIHAREADCREELRLNSRLAPQIYLAVVPLTLAPSGEMFVGGEGEIVDWLVEMRRLPAERMLDRLIAGGSLGARNIEALAEKLGEFYANASRSALSARGYVARFFREHEENRRILTMRDLALDRERPHALLDRIERLLVVQTPALEARAHEGRIVDGHGDLRPEHICFCEPLAIFDCLEFNAELRQVDPFDELAFLDLECASLGAPQAGAAIVAATAQRLGEAPPRLSRARRASTSRSYPASPTLIVTG